jgi:hypothetical protein
MMSAGSSTTQMIVPSCISAVAAALALGDVEALGADRDSLLRSLDRLGECERLVGVRSKQVESQTLRALLADPGEPAERVDQILDGAFEQGFSPRSLRSLRRRAAS